MNGQDTGTSRVTRLAALGIKVERDPLAPTPPLLPATPQRVQVKQESPEQEQVLDPLALLPPPPLSLPKAEPRGPPSCGSPTPNPRQAEDPLLLVRYAPKDELRRPQFMAPPSCAVTANWQGARPSTKLEPCQGLLLSTTDSREYLYPTAFPKGGLGSVRMDLPPFDQANLAALASFTAGVGLSPPYTGLAEQTQLGPMPWAPATQLQAAAMNYGASVAISAASKPASVYNQPGPTLTTQGISPMNYSAPLASFLGSGPMPPPSLPSATLPPYSGNRGHYPMFSSAPMNYQLWPQTPSVSPMQPPSQPGLLTPPTNMAPVIQQRNCVLPPGILPHPEPLPEAISNETIVPDLRAKQTPAPVVKVGANEDSDAADFDLYFWSNSEDENNSEPEYDQRYRVKVSLQQIQSSDRVTRSHTSLNGQSEQSLPVLSDLHGSLEATGTANQNRKRMSKIQCKKTPQGNSILQQTNTPHKNISPQQNVSQQKKIASKRTATRRRRISDSSDSDESLVERRVTRAQSAHQNIDYPANFELHNTGEGIATDPEEFEDSESESSRRDSSAESSESEDDESVSRIPIKSQGDPPTQSCITLPAIAPSSKRNVHEMLDEGRQSGMSGLHMFDQMPQRHFAPRNVAVVRQENLLLQLLLDPGFRALSGVRGSGEVPSTRPGAFGEMGTVVVSEYGASGVETQDANVQKAVTDKLAENESANCSEKFITHVPKSETVINHCRGPEIEKTHETEAKVATATGRQTVTDLETCASGTEDSNAVESTTKLVTSQEPDDTKDVTEPGDVPRSSTGATGRMVCVSELKPNSFTKSGISSCGSRMKVAVESGPKNVPTDGESGASTESSSQLQALWNSAQAADEPMEVTGTNITENSDTDMENYSTIIGEICRVNVLEFHDMISFLKCFVAALSVSLQRMTSKESVLIALKLIVTQANVHTEIVRNIMQDCLLWLERNPPELFADRNEQNVRCNVNFILNQVLEATQALQINNSVLPADCMVVLRHIVEETWMCININQIAEPIHEPAPSIQKTAPSTLWVKNSAPKSGATLSKKLAHRRQSGMAESHMFVQASLPQLQSPPAPRGVSVVRRDNLLLQVLLDPGFGATPSGVVKGGEVCSTRQMSFGGTGAGGGQSSIGITATNVNAKNSEIIGGNFGENKSANGSDMVISVPEIETGVTTHRCGFEIEKTLETGTKVTAITGWKAVMNRCRQISDSSDGGESLVRGRVPLPRGMKQQKAVVTVNLEFNDLAEGADETVERGAETSWKVSSVVSSESEQGESLSEIPVRRQAALPMPSLTICPANISTPVLGKTLREAPRGFTVDPGSCVSSFDVGTSEVPSMKPNDTGEACTRAVSGYGPRGIGTQVANVGETVTDNVPENESRNGVETKRAGGRIVSGMTVTNVPAKEGMCEGVRLDTEKTETKSNVAAAADALSVMSVDSSASGTEVSNEAETISAVQRQLVIAPEPNWTKDTTKPRDIPVTDPGAARGRECQSDVRTESLTKTVIVSRVIQSKGGLKSGPENASKDSKPGTSTESSSRVADQSNSAEATKEPVEETETTVAENHDTATEHDITIIGGSHHAHVTEHVDVNRFVKRFTAALKFSLQKLSSKESVRTALQSIVIRANILHVRIVGNVMQDCLTTLEASPAELFAPENWQSVGCNVRFILNEVLDAAQALQINSSSGKQASELSANCKDILKRIALDTWKCMNIDHIVASEKTVLSTQNPVRTPRVQASTLQEPEEVVLSDDDCFPSDPWAPDLDQSIALVSNPAAGLPCCSCGLTFSSRHQLETHKAEKHSGSGPFTCYSCGKVWPTKQQFLYHLLSHGPAVYECSYCDKRFPSLRGRNYHMKQHTDKSECPVCHKGFSKRGILSHMLIHEGHVPKRCSVCAMQFVLERDLKIHMQLMHQSYKPLKCDIYEEALSKDGGLQSHTQIHNGGGQSMDLTAHTDSELLCKICSSIFDNHNELEIHRVLKHAATGPFTCYSCGKVNPTQRTYYTHLRNHGPKIHKCDICSKGFALKNRMRAHKSHHLGGVVCPICKKILSSADYLKQHLRIHDEARPYQCEQCGKCFRCSTAWLTHKKRIHSDARPHQCEVCGKDFKTGHDLRKHKLTHNDNRPYMCGVCGKTFRQKPYCERHEKAHSKAEIHKCDLCNKTYSFYAGMRKHRQTVHEGLRPFKCDVCNRFPLKQQLISHMPIHTGETKFQCKVCLKMFRRETNLNQHMVTHISERRFECDRCGSRFNFKHHLIQHLTRQEPCSPSETGTDT